ncbi:hypothetical protein O3P69_001369 [Scylla paramamosain]|uniref:Potassium channel domain-containing protein n=1 Tax=Scylla paramamosain TaxID=85552 RepID=A0AAW0UPY6_SCYPA
MGVAWGRRGGRGPCTSASGLRMLSGWPASSSASDNTSTCLLRQLHEVPRERREAERQRQTGRKEAATRLVRRLVTEWSCTTPPPPPLPPLALLHSSSTHAVTPTPPREPWWRQRASGAEEVQKGGAPLITDLKPPLELPSSRLLQRHPSDQIGYGNIAPDTAWGKMFRIVFSLVGTPLSLTVLVSLGRPLVSLLPVACIERLLPRPGSRVILCRLYHQDQDHTRRTSAAWLWRHLALHLGRKQRTQKFLDRDHQRTRRPQTHI